MRNYDYEALLLDRLIDFLLFDFRVQSLKIWLGTVVSRCCDSWALEFLRGFERQHLNISRVGDLLGLLALVFL